MQTCHPPPRLSSLPYLHTQGSDDEDSAGSRSDDFDSLLDLYDYDRLPYAAVHVQPLTTQPAPLPAPRGPETNFSRPLAPPPLSTQMARPDGAQPQEGQGLWPELSPPLQLSPSPSPPDANEGPALSPEASTTLPGSVAARAEVAAAQRAIAVLPGLSRAIGTEVPPALAALLQRCRSEGEAIDRSVRSAWDAANLHGQWGAFEPLLVALTEAQLGHARAVLLREDAKPGAKVTQLAFKRTFGRPRTPYLKVTVAGVASTLPLALDALRHVEQGALSASMCLVLQRFYHHLSTLLDRAPLTEGTAASSRQGHKQSLQYMQLRGSWLSLANDLGHRARRLQPGRANRSLLTPGRLAQPTLRAPLLPGSAPTGPAPRPAIPLPR